MKTVAIIILNWNGKKDTLECLASLASLTYPHFFTIVVDNHSSDDSCEEIAKKFPKVMLIQNQENLGFAEGNNVGIRLALEKKADFLFLLNNDTIVSPSILEAFLEAVQKKPQGGIFGGKLYQYHNPSFLDHLGGIWDPKQGNFRCIGGNEKASYFYDEPLDYVCGCALFCKKEVIEKIGMLDPRFFLLWEESDFCFQARHEGWKVFSVEKAQVWHKGSASFSGGKPHMHYFWWRNRLLWIEKNLSTKERIFLYIRVLFPQILQVYRRYGKKVLMQKFFAAKQTERKRKELLHYVAGRQGIEDYWKRRFGPLPASLWEKISPSKKN
ncbi:MAG: glycosyltransferase family 2 protein [Chlamydiota bacterium]